MKNPSPISFLSNTAEPRDHAACGTGITVELSGPTHDIVQEGLHKLANFGYRSGYNPMTGESDGAGLRLYGLPTRFFQKKLAEGQFLDSEGKIASLRLEEGNFAVGQYFFPEEKLEDCKDLVEATLRKNGLKIAGWRNLNAHVSKEAVSESAWKKKPSLWQAILVPERDELALEPAAMQALKDITEKARQQNIRMQVVSQSSFSIVYKGMILADKLGDFYAEDLRDPDFTATAEQEHGRMATNTNPQWANAQPCPSFIAHNGEFNSRLANAKEMEKHGMNVNYSLSDSMQFDTHLAHLILEGHSFEEAFLHLITIPNAKDYPQEIREMLTYFQQQWTPYDGPGFVVAGHEGEFIARLDKVGLRPARWIITEDAKGNRRFHAHSDDDVTVTAGGKIIQRGNLEPGGFIMVTRDGQILRTKEVLERIYQKISSRGVDFSALLKERLIDIDALEPVPGTSAHPLELEEQQTLHRKLYAAFQDYESIETVLHDLALHGKERVGAMGNDVSLLPPLDKANKERMSVPLHISYFFHQLFAQVSAPPLDSIKERDRFDLSTTLGPKIDLFPEQKRVVLHSPILTPQEFARIEAQKACKIHVLDTSFMLPPSGTSVASKEYAKLLSDALKNLLAEAEAKAKE